MTNLEVRNTKSNSLTAVIQNIQYFAHRKPVCIIRLPSKDAKALLKMHKRKLDILLKAEVNGIMTIKFKPYSDKYNFIPFKTLKNENSTTINP